MKITEIMIGMIFLPICAIMGCKFFKYIYNKNIILEKNIIIVCNLIVGSVPLYVYFFN